MTSNPPALLDASSPRASAVGLALAAACIALSIATAGAVHVAASAALAGALIAAALLSSAPAQLERIPKAPAIAVAAALAACALTLVPLPEALRAILAPGPTRARSDLRALGLAGSWAPISVDVGATVQEALLWSGAGALLVLVHRGPRALATLRVASIALAVIHALAGLDRWLGTGVLPLTYIEDPWRVGQEALRAESHAGWLINRNHWAALGAMLVPLAAAAAWSARSPARRVGLAVVALATAASVVTTRSRSGLGALVLEAAAFAVFAAIRSGSRARRAALVVAAVAAIVAWPLAVARLRGALGEDAVGRPTLYASVARVVAASPVVGWGPGTLRAAFPAFQPASLPYTCIHAHCDPLEVVQGAGILGLVVLVALCVHVVRCSRDASVPAGARLAWALAIAGTALVSLVEFPLQVAAVRFAWLAVLFAGPALLAPAGASRAASPKA